MYRTNGRIFKRTLTRASLGSLIAIAACSSGKSDTFESENVGTAQQSLLSSPCNVAGGNMVLTINDGEIGYVTKVAGCTVEPCLWANGNDSTGQRCMSNSSAPHTISIVGGGMTTYTEKVVFDFSNGLFNVATTSTPLMTVVLDNPTSGAAVSKVMVIPQATGANMALGANGSMVNGLDINTLATRTAQFVDMTIKGSGSDVNPVFEFSGGVGSDIVTGDIAGWSTALPKGWTAGLATAFSWTPTTLNLNLSGGAGADILAGGAGTNSLIGGPGNDTFLQSTTPHAEAISGGDDVDTVDYSNRTAAVFVTPNSNTGIATATITTGLTMTGYLTGDVVSVATGTTGLLATYTVTAASGAVTVLTPLTSGDGYAVGTGVATTDITTPAATGLTVDIATIGANDGAALEGDDVQTDVEIVNGGPGNDVLNAYAVAATDVVLMGNGGNDQLTGGGGNDDLCGGAGNDTFYENAGNDFLVGGAGTDTADYTAGTGVIACLNQADTVAVDGGSPKPCFSQNGGTFTVVVGDAGVSTPEQDLVNNVSSATAKVCPRAALNIGKATGGTKSAAPTTPGGAMAVDVENLTGNATAANTLRCGTLSCTLLGSTTGDHLAGGAANDQIYGNGGADVVTTNGGTDLVDLTHPAGSNFTETVDCANNSVTILVSAGDTMNPVGTTCANANIP